MARPSITRGIPASHFTLARTRRTRASDLREYHYHGGSRSFMTRLPIGQQDFEALSDRHRRFVEGARDWVWTNRDVSEWLDEPFLHVTLGGVRRAAITVPRILLDSFKRAVGMAVECEDIGPYEVVAFPVAA